MLFKTLYTWIKYKTLPPSILFKNRLFIERDIKHRRITTTLGLTFRNSKWSSYARPNISPKLLENFSNFSRWIFYFTLLLTFTLYFFSYYIFFELNNNITSLIWFFFDSITFSYLFLYFAGLTLWHNFYFYITKIYTNNLRLKRNTSSFLQTQPLPKNLQKYVLYSWLKNGKSCDKQVENFFTNHKLVNYDITIPQTLYKTIKIITATTDTTSGLFYRTQIQSAITKKTLNKMGFIGWSRNNQNFRLFSAVLLDYLVQVRSLETNKKVVDLSSFTNSVNKTKWNLYNLDLESSLSFNSLKTFKGGFYLPYLNPNLTNFFTSNYSNPVFISTTINNSLQSIKSYYWLYKYSLLHRATFKNSHNLTIVKKLLTTGFYDTTVKTNNLWAAEECSNTTIPALKNLLYNTSNFDYDFFLNEGTVPNPLFLKKTSFFQKSFNWFLTRTFLFNGLKTSSLSSGYGILNKKTTPTEGNIWNDSLNFFTNSGLRTLVLSNQYYMGKLNYPKTFLLKTTLTTFNNNTKDVYILDRSQTSFNLTDIRFLTSLFQNNTIGSKQFYYSELPLNFSKIYANKSLDLLFKSGHTQPNLKNFYPTNSQAEEIFTQDLTLYLLFLNR